MSEETHEQAHYAYVEHDEGGEIVGVIRCRGNWLVQNSNMVKLDDPYAAVSADTHIVDLPTRRVVARTLPRANSVVPYQVRRRRAYPPIADQLDALWKGGDALAEMRARVLAVKQEIPKE